MEQYDRAVQALKHKYFVREKKIESSPGCWNTLLVEVFMVVDDLSIDTPDGSGTIKIGEYKRNYHTLFNTFFPFCQGGQDFALYSCNYTATRVMTLPDCQDWCGEEPGFWGFCPVDFFVPHGEARRGIDGSFGFVAGCVWGDDSSWKIEYLNLSKLGEKEIAREQRFGYVSLPCDMSLEEAIDLEHYWVGDLETLNKDGELETTTLDDDTVALATGHLFSLNRQITDGCCDNACECKCGECMDKRKYQQEAKESKAAQVE